jgi:hypothetical protein
LLPSAGTSFVPLPVHLSQTNVLVSENIGDGVVPRLLPPIASITCFTAIAFGSFSSRFIYTLMSLRFSVLT